MGLSVRAVRSAGLLAFALWGMLWGGAAAAARESLCFGMITTTDFRTALDIWQPLVEDMSAAVGIPITSRPFEDYAGVVWAMGEGRVHIAAMGNKIAIEAVDRAGGEVAFRKMELDGEDGYRAHIVTHVRSGLLRIDDVFSRAGQITFGNGDPNSTSGFVVPGFYIFARRGVEPSAVFKRVTRANHLENLLAVSEGRADVATSNSTALKRFARQYPEKHKDIRVIWTSPLIPSDPIVWRTDLPEAHKTAISAFLLDYGRDSPDKSRVRLDHERSVLEKITISGFVASDNRQLRPIRQLELFRLHNLVRSDTSLSAEQRARKLKELDGRIGFLDDGQEAEEQR